MKTFGHRHLRWWFRPLFEADDTTLRYRGRDYSLSAIRVESEVALGGAGHFPKAGMVLALPDGARIRIDGRSFGARDARPRVGFVTGVSDDYVALQRRLGFYGRSRDNEA